MEERVTEHGRELNGRECWLAELSPTQMPLPSVPSAQVVGGDGLGLLLFLLALGPGSGPAEGSGVGDGLSLLLLPIPILSWVEWGDEAGPLVQL